MPELDDLAGRHVLIMLGKWDDLALLGVTKDTFMAKVTGVNQLGLWIENPAWESIPEGREKPAVHRIEILLRWDRIRSIVNFPDSTGVDDSRLAKIGFRG